MYKDQVVSWADPALVRADVTLAMVLVKANKLPYYSSYPVYLSEWQRAPHILQFSVMGAIERRIKALKGVEPCQNYPVV